MIQPGHESNSDETAGAQQSVAVINTTLQSNAIPGSLQLLDEMEKLMVVEA